MSSGWQSTGYPRWIQRNQDHWGHHDHHQVQLAKEPVPGIRGTRPRDRRKSCMCTMHRARVSRSRIKMEGWIRVLHRSCPFSVITFCVLTRGSLEALAHADYFSYGQSRTTQPAPPSGHTTGEYFLSYKKVVDKGLLTCTIQSKLRPCVPQLYCSLNILISEKPLNVRKFGYTVCSLTETT